jgi:hypothetical protein
MLWRPLAKLLGNTEPVDGRAFVWMVALGLVAGGVKATIHRNPQTKWLDIVAAAFGSALSSYITGSVLLYYWGPERLLVILPICGVAGWIGVALLDLWGAYAWGIAQTKLPPAQGGEKTQSKE